MSDGLGLLTLSHQLICRSFNRPASIYRDEAEVEVCRAAIFAPHDSLHRAHLPGSVRSSATRASDVSADELERGAGREACAPHGRLSQRD